MGVVCSLGIFWCRAGCSVSRVASMLAFYPPRPPYYAIKEDPETGGLELWLDPLLAPILPVLQAHPHIEVDLVPTSRGQRVAVVFFGRPSATTTILYSHANATDLGVMLDRFAELSTLLGVNVVGYDYTGYGASSGSVPSEEDCYADIEAVFDWLTSYRAPHTQVVLYGQSVGSGPSVYLASKLAMQQHAAAAGGTGGEAGCGGGRGGWFRVKTVNSSHSSGSKQRKKRQRPQQQRQQQQQQQEASSSCGGNGGVSGLILHSGLSSGMRVVTSSRALGCLDIFPNVDRLPSVRCPVLVIHGTEDREVPLHHGEALHSVVPAEFKREPYWVGGRAHNDIGEAPEDKAEYYDRLRAFLRSLPTPAPSPHPSAQQLQAGSLTGGLLSSAIRMVKEQAHDPAHEDSKVYEDEEQRQCSEASFPHEEEEASSCLKKQQQPTPPSSSTAKPAASARRADTSSSVAPAPLVSRGAHQ